MKNEAIKEFLLMQLSILNQAAYRQGASRADLHTELDDALDATDRLYAGLPSNPQINDFIAKIVDMNKKPN